MVIANLFEIFQKHNEKQLFFSLYSLVFNYIICNVFTGWSAAPYTAMWIAPPGARFEPGNWMKPTCQPDLWVGAGILWAAVLAWEGRQTGAAGGPAPKHTIYSTEIWYKHFTQNWTIYIAQWRRTLSLLGRNYL